MTDHPALTALLSREGVSLVPAADIDAFLAADPETVTALFFCGDPHKRLEAADVAVVLSELLKTYPEDLRGGVIAIGEEAGVMQARGVFALPSLTLHHAGERLAVIAKIQDWSVYAEKVREALVRAGRLTAATG